MFGENVVSEIVRACLHEVGLKSRCIEEGQEVRRLNYLSYLMLFVWVTVYSVVHDSKEVLYERVEKKSINDGCERLEESI